MLKIYVFKNQEKQFLCGQKADEVLVSADPGLLQSFSDYGIVGNIPIMGKTEHFIDPTSKQIVSGKHLPGSKLKISAADLFSLKDNYILALLWKSDLSLHFHANVSSDPADDEQTIYVFQRIAA